MIASSTSVTRDRRFSPTRAATMVSRRPRASCGQLPPGVAGEAQGGCRGRPGSSTLSAPWPRPSVTTLPPRAPMRST